MDKEIVTRTAVRDKLTMTLVRQEAWADPSPLSWLVCWLLNVQATCECISGTDLRRQFYVLPH